MPSLSLGKWRNEPRVCVWGYSHGQWHMQINAVPQSEMDNALELAGPGTWYVFQENFVPREHPDFYFDENGKPREMAER